MWFSLKSVYGDDPVVLTTRLSVAGCDNYAIHRHAAGQLAVFRGH
jgi:hypothetical protein